MPFYQKPNKEKLMIQKKVAAVKKQNVSKNIVNATTQVQLVVLNAVVLTVKILRRMQKKEKSKKSYKNRNKWKKNKCITNNNKC